MTTRQFDFVTTIETSQAPIPVDPSNPNDPITLGFADDRYAQGQVGVADIAALKALVVADRRDRDLILVAAKNAVYRYDSGSAAAGDDDRIVEPTAGAGRYFLVSPIESVSGDLTVPGALIVTGDLNVNGTTTTINTATLNVEDANITVNKGGDEASADAQVSGLTVEMSDATDARIGFDSNLASKFKAGEVGSESEVMTTGSAQTISGQKTVNDLPIHFEELGSSPSTPPSGYRGLYATSSGFSQIDDAGVITDVGAGAGGNEVVFSTSADYTILDNDDYTTILVTTGGTNKTITLPTASANSNRLLKIKKIDSGAGFLIIDGEGSETIDGATTQTFTKEGDSLSIQCDGSNWFIVSWKRYYIKEVKNLDNNYTAGKAVIIRSADRVSITIKDMGWSGSQTALLTSVGFLPTWARPNRTMRPVTSLSAAHITRIDVQADGQMALRFFNATLSTTASSDAATFPFDHCVNFDIE